MRSNYYSKIILDSIGDVNNPKTRLTTFEIAFPRFISEHLLTHAMLRRNAGSRRAVPTWKFLETASVEPLDYAENQPGMIAGAPLRGFKRLLARLGWQIGRCGAILGAKLMETANCHKQTTNQVLTPYLWQTYVVTSNSYGWNNFFEQRMKNDVQPELQHLAKLMFTDYSNSQPRRSTSHYPYDPLYDNNQYAFIETAREHKLGLREVVKQISTARIARVSLFNHGCDRIDYEKDISLFNRLRNSGHYSPFDHILEYREEFTNGIFPHWISYREQLFPQFIQER